MNLRHLLRPPPPALAPTTPNSPHWQGMSLAQLTELDEPALPVQPHGFPVPTAGLRASAGVADLALWLGIGEAWAQIVAHYLRERAMTQPLVLDLGCGCGKLARFLHLNPALSYVGVDLFAPAIVWCARVFADSFPRFRFEHFDGISGLYNPGGCVAVSDYRLPVDDGAVDLVVAGSLFTHLLEPDARHYLAELGRVLTPGGLALISLHVEPPPGQHYVGDEARMDVDEAYFAGLAAAAGLPAVERVGVVYGQTVLALSRL